MNTNLLQYQGRLSSEVRIQLIDLVKCIALCDLGPRSDLKKLVSVALELLDNAQRYNAGKEVDFTWHIADDQLVVRVTNMATAHNAQRLMRAVEEISRMSPEEITQAFNQALRSEGFGANGGAGLGMLQIASKAGSGIKAHMEKQANGAILCRSEVTTPLTPKIN